MELAARAPEDDATKEVAFEGYTTGHPVGGCHRMFEASSASGDRSPSLRVTCPACLSLSTIVAQRLREPSGRPL
jgi:hypothetical protein